MPNDILCVQSGTHDPHLGHPDERILDTFWSYNGRNFDFKKILQKVKCPTSAQGSLWGELAYRVHHHHLILLLDTKFIIHAIKA